MKALFLKLYFFILGKHPRNTVFSYNYVNVRHINRFLRKQASSLNTELTIADIGAGQCPYFPQFKNHCKIYYAVDFKDSLPQNPDPIIQCIEGTAEKINLPDESVDVLISNQVLEHVISPEQSVSEFYRILKPGGLFIGSVPHVSPIHLEPYDYRRYTEYGILQLFDSTGFKEIQIEGNGGVFQSATLMITMDFVLSKHQNQKPQKFSAFRSFVFFPLIGFLNVHAILMDTILGNKKRSPSNYCWTARK